MPIRLETINVDMKLFFPSAIFFRFISSSSAEGVSDNHLQLINCLLICLFVNMFYMFHTLNTNVLTVNFFA